MGMRAFGVATVLGAALLVAGCAIRLGGPKPEEYNATALRVPAGATADAVVAQLKAASADLALISTQNDSAWLASVATQSGLTLTGPGRTGPTLGLFSRLKVLGDTALTIPVEGGGKLHVMDALFEIDKNRSIDLMIASFAEGTGVREGVRALLNYVASDVSGTSSVVIAVEAGRPAANDSAAVLMRAAFTSALECGGAPRATPEGGLGVALFYGPEARLTCSTSRIVAGPSPAIVARVNAER